MKKLFIAVWTILITIFISTTGFAQDVIQYTQTGQLDDLASKWGQYMGLLSAFVLFFDRLAKLTPIEADNKIVEKILKGIYTITAILGVKVPDIDKISDLTNSDKK